MPHHASGERGDKPTENQAVGRQGWMPMHSTETPQHLVNAFLAMILLSEINPLESCDPDPPLRCAMPRAAGSALQTMQAPLTERKH